jgi:hypothetical protein
MAFRPRGPSPGYIDEIWKEVLKLLSSGPKSPPGPDWLLFDAISNSGREDPQPQPWFTLMPSLLLSGIALKQVAANLLDGQAITAAADQAIAQWEDDYCGTPPHPLPSLALAASLAAFAGSLQPGDLQTAIQEEASRLARKAFGPVPATDSPAAKAA